MRQYGIHANDGDMLEVLDRRAMDVGIIATMPDTDEVAPSQSCTWCATD
jgi:hypothetical protein